jgi:hypothetical protein
MATGVASEHFKNDETASSDDHSDETEESEIIPADSAAFLLLVACRAAV